MAGLDTEPLEPRPEPHDGLALCRVCATPDADAGHDWCEAAGGLVCRTCCRRRLLGDVGRMMAVSAGVAEPDEDTFGALGACATCERGQRWFARHVLGFMTRGSSPN
jgi:hypothetical protein